MSGEVWTGNEKVFRTYLKGGGKDGKRCVDRHKGISNVITRPAARGTPISIMER